MSELTMHRVIINANSLQLLRANTPGYRLVGERVLGTNTIEIQLDNEVLERLKQIDPDIDKAISKACSGQFGNA